MTVNEQKPVHEEAGASHVAFYLFMGFMAVSSLALLIYLLFIF